MKTYAVKTFGCSMNYSDTERVCSVLEAQGLHEIEDILEADITVLTTCSIKQKAEDKVFSTIHNLHKNRKKKGKENRIVLTGCMVKKTSSQHSEEKDELLTRIPEIDIVFRIEDILLLPELLGIGKTDTNTSFFNILPKHKSKFQAIVPIQTGCDNFCSYCVVPFTRGREKSRSIEEILKEITFLAKRGLKEVNLVGQNVNSYGKGLPNIQRQFDEENAQWIQGEGKTPFALLLEKVNDIEGLERIRFQSSNPHDMTDDIIEAVTSLSKVMPSLHFAVQSADDEVLKKMNRRHTWKDYVDIVEKIRNKRPDFAITTDIIVGFCGESDEAFKKSLKGMQKIDVDIIYISQYSPRKGTPAYKTLVDDIPQEVKKERWHTMNNWLKKHVAEKMKSLIGTKQKVLIEHINDQGLGEGKTEHNRACQVHGKNFHIGDIIEVQITDSSQWAIYGEQIN